MKRVLAMVSSSGVIDEYSSGIAYYKWLKELDDHFDFVALKQKLESVYKGLISISFNFIFYWKCVQT